MTKQRIQIRETSDYDKACEEIAKTITKYNFTFVEAFGVLECSRAELIDLHNNGEYEDD